jgi:hypothetical protein
LQNQKIHSALIALSINGVLSLQGRLAGTASITLAAPQGAWQLGIAGRRQIAGPHMCAES